MTKLSLAWLAGCTLALSAPNPAFATPPDIIDIVETPFGLSETHLFVLRSSSDNLGLYDSMRTETFLVAIDLSTGEEEFWLVDRAERTLEYDVDGDPLDHVVKRDAGATVINPISILTERGGLVWSAIELTLVEPTLGETETGYTLSYPGGITFGIDKTTIAQRFARMTTFMAENVADRRRMSTMSTREVFAGRFASADDCKPGDVLESAAMRAYPVFQIVRVECTSDIDDGITAFVSVWPVVGDNGSTNDGP